MNSNDASSHSNNLWAWTDKYKLSKEEVNAYADPDWVIDNLIIQGHLVAIVSEPNGGKTTLLTHLAREMAQQCYEVIYINSDISGGDAKAMHLHAHKHGYQLLLPDMKADLSMDNVIDDIGYLASLDVRMDDTVFIFDTLKKMTDVINKKKAKDMYKLLRKITAKGATVIVLGHTNKYADKDDNPIYEGTGDLRSDVDELIYLIPQHNSDGSISVSTKPDKVRGIFEQLTFHISQEREVTQSSEYVDIIGNREDQQVFDDDINVIQKVIESIQSGKRNQTEIIGYCKPVAGRKRVEEVLSRYMDEPNKQWTRTKVPKNNTWQYTIAC